jgi:two-component system osmolarity sensor histidine kinase EnvZ
MSRLFDTIAVRLLLLVAACVALSIGLTWLVMHSGAITPEHEIRAMADRIAGVATALEAAPASAREPIAAHASAAGYALHWVAKPPGETEPAPASVLGSALGASLGLPKGAIRRLPAKAGILVIPLRDGSALTVAVAPTLAFAEAPKFTLPLTLLCASALLVCLLAARTAAQGMAHFVRTAEHFGRAGTVQKLPLRGPREVRAAITAFNAMQARIERVMGERTAMLGALSHDLRTPLARMRLRAEFLADEREQRRMLRDLDEMEAMVNQSLDFLRDDSRTEPPTKLDLAVLLQGIAEEQADLGREVAFHGPEHATIQARPLSLKRAIANIVENAVKYGTKADIELRLEGKAASVSVSDDGPGIPESLRERVFEPFYRAEASRNRETGGVGLGLSIARAVIRSHGGEIRLADHALGGLIVRVDLPIGATA